MDRLPISYSLEDSFQRIFKGDGRWGGEKIWPTYTFTRLHTLVCDKIVIDKNVYLCWVPDINFNPTYWVLKYYWVTSHECPLFYDHFLYKWFGVFSSTFTNSDDYVICFLIHTLLLFICYFHDRCFCGLFCYHSC